MTAKTYLITGAAGFIGARFVESCNRSGITVISVDEKKFFPGGAEERPEHAGIEFGQIVDRDELFEWLGRNSPPISAVVHMGACSRTTETDVAYLKRVNVEYSQKLWTYCAESKIPLVYASSAATYGAGELGYSDDESVLSKLNPLNEYGRSKAYFDVWALEQETAGHVPPSWAGFKFFNVYGYGERHKGSQASVVLHAYDQIRENGRVKLFKSHRPGIADGEQKRDFIAIEDVIRVLHYALDQPVRRGVLNLGTGRAQSFLDLAQAVFEALDQPVRIDFIDTPLEIRDKYQYFTEARMERLRDEGYVGTFLTLKQGVAEYVKRLEQSKRRSR